MRQAFKNHGGDEGFLTEKERVKQEYNGPVEYRAQVEIWRNFSKNPRKLLHRPPGSLLNFDYISS